MGLCITSIAKTLTDSHTLDDRNHQGHHTTLLLSETLLSTAQVSLCVGEVRSLKSTGSLCREFWSQVSTCILTGYRLNKSLHLTTWGSEWSYASGFATRLTLCQTFLTMSGFRTRHIFCCQVTWTLRTTSSWVAHPLSTVCKSHYTLWSALPGLPSPNMASLEHSGSRTTMSDLWQSTPSNMSRCLASSGQHLVDGVGSSGSSSGSSRMVPPPILKRVIGMTTAVFPWPTDQPQMWPAVVAAFTGLEPPRFLSVGMPGGQGVWQQPPDYPWPEGSNHSSINKSDPKGGMWEGHRELCLPDPNVPAASRSSFGAHFLCASETRSFCSTDLKLCRCLLQRLDLMSLKFCVNLNKNGKFFDFWWWPFFLCHPVRNIRKLIKSSKDSDSSLVSNQNFNEILWSSSWALGQVTWAKMANNLPQLWCHSQKNRNPKPKKIFSLQTKRLAKSFEGLNRSLAQSAEELCCW